MQRNGNEDSLFRLCPPPEQRLHFATELEASSRAGDKKERGMRESACGGNEASQGKGNDGKEDGQDGPTIEGQHRPSDALGHASPLVWQEGYAKGPRTQGGTEDDHPFLKPGFLPNGGTKPQDGDARKG